MNTGEEAICWIEAGRFLLFWGAQTDTGAYVASRAGRGRSRRSVGHVFAVGRPCPRGTEPRPLGTSARLVEGCTPSRRDEVPSHRSLVRVSPGRGVVSAVTTSSLARTRP